MAFDEATWYMAPEAREAGGEDGGAAKGLVTVVGLGPGSKTGMTVGAIAALEEADLVVGYKAYLELVKPLLADKRTVATGMGGELDRCRTALEQAQAGARVALVCSGDAGVYGMASPLLELSVDYPGVEVAVEPGVTAALTGAAMLGAPLGHDFATVSLSDLLTPWDLIVRRLTACVQADLCLALYNPASRQRPDHLRRAVQVLLDAGAPESLVCGWARNVGRIGAEAGTCTLAELADLPADMFTTVFIGNSQTRLVAGRMVTPRGYRGLA